MDTIQLAQNLRKSVLEMTHAAKTSHVGSAFSMIDLIAVLYGRVLKFRPSEPKWKERDRFILSKGHAGSALYAVLAEVGFFDRELLKNYCKNDSAFFGHPSHDSVPGIEISTGSLGHGLPIGVGMALSAQMDKHNYRVFVLLSDGECDEGSNWEAALFAGHHRMSSLVAVIDYNKLQALGNTNEVLNLEPLKSKFENFGWDCIEIDGHNHDEIYKAFDAQNSRREKPLCVIAHTIKGKGVSFMEGNLTWHYRPPMGEDFEKAKKELG